MKSNVAKHIIKANHAFNTLQDYLKILEYGNKDQKSDVGNILYI
jgi:beta-lactamase class D